MRFRTARLSDAPKLLEIYREYIDTTITFEYALPSVEEFAGRIRSISEFFPYLVLEDDAETIVGYAYAHRHMGRPTSGMRSSRFTYRASLREKAGDAGPTVFCLNSSRFRA